MKNKFIITLILLTSVTVPYQKAFAISTSSNTVSVLASVDDKHPISNGAQNGYPSAIWYTDSSALLDVNMQGLGYSENGEVDYGKVTQTGRKFSNGGYYQNDYVISAVRGKTKKFNINLAFKIQSSTNGKFINDTIPGGKAYVELGTHKNQSYLYGLNCSFDINAIANSISGNEFTIKSYKDTSTYVFAWIDGGTVEDYLTQAKGNIININQTNGLSQTDILNTLKSGIDNSLANVSIENYSYKPSTDAAAGYYKGTVRVTRLSDNTSDTFNLNVTIPQIPQSIDSVYNSYNKIIPSLKVNNKTTAQDIINTVNISNNNIKVSIDNFKVNSATDIKEGTITGTLKIVEGSTIKTIPINLSIDKLAQSSNTASNNITSVLDNIKCTNNTTVEEILRAVKVGIDTSSVDVKFSSEEGEEFKIIRATESTEGSITGMIIVNDGKSNVKVPVNVKIDRLPQSIETVFDQYTKVIQNFKGNNQTTEKDILESVNITNKDIVSSINGFKKIESTDINEGSIIGTIILNNGLTRLEVPINIKIDKLAQSSETASKIIDSMLANLKCTNSTTEEEILNAIRAGIDTSVVQVNFSNEKDEESKITRATESTEGNITGVIIVNDGKSNVKVPVNIKIDRLPQSLETVHEQYLNIVGNFKGSNATTEDDILSVVNITNKEILSTIENFKKVDATDVKEGIITGNIIISRGSESLEVPLNIKIDKLAQSSATACKIINAMIENLKCTNTTTEEEILNAIKVGIDTSAVQVDFSKEEGKKFNIVPATESSTGKITGNIIVDDGNSIEEIGINIIVDKLPQSLESLYEQANVAINGYKATNNTTQEDILNLVHVKNDSISKTLEGFSITPATETSKGHLNGKLILSDGTLLKEILLNNVGIDYLEQSLNTAKTKVQNVLNRYTLYNNTTKEEIINIVKSVIDTNLYDAEATINIIKEATTDTPGNAKINIKIIDNSNPSNYLEIDNTYKVATDPIYQNSEQLQNKLTNFFLTYEPSNNTEEQDIFAAINKSGIQTNPLLTLEFGENDEKFEKVKATDVSNGEISGIIYINKNQGMVDLTKDNKLIIKYNPSYQTIDTLKAKIEDYIKNLELPSNTEKKYAEEIISKDLITSSDLNIEIENYNKESSTSSIKGNITGNIVITDLNGNSKVIDNITIVLDLDKTNQTLEEAKKDIEKILINYKPTNNTTKDELIDYIKTAISNPLIDVDIDDEKFEKILATSKNDGNLKASINLSNGSDTIQVNTENLLIEKTKEYQTLDELKTDIGNILINFRPTNETSYNDLIDYIDKVITNDNYSIEIPIGEENFKKELATSRKDGSIVANILIKDNLNHTESIKNTGELVIDKCIQYQTKEDVSYDITDKMKDFIADNSTTKESLLDFLNEIVSDKFILDIKEEEFLKVLATSKNDGKLEAIINIIDKSDNSNTTKPTGAIIINKQPIYQTDEEINVAINDILKDYKAGNQTNKDDILNLVSSVIINGKNVGFGEALGEQFEKKESSTSSTGTITGVLVIGDMKIPITLEIPKKHSSSSSSKNELDSNIENVLNNSSKSFSLLGIEREDIMSDVNTLNIQGNIEAAALIEGDSEIYAISVPYEEDNVTTGISKTKGEMKLLYTNKECVGILLESDSKYDEDTVVNIKTKGIEAEEIKAYSHNEDLDKYIKIEPEIKIEDDVLKMRGTGKSKYILSTKNLSEKNVAQQGWNENNNEWKYLKDEDCVAGWVKDNDEWYNLNDNKIMRTGWVKDKDGWYYLNPVSDGTKGSMKTGWQKIDSNWYYLNPTSDGTKGTMKTGWQKIDSNWYYFNNDGTMAKDTNIDGYNINASGELI